MKTILVIGAGLMLAAGIKGGVDFKTAYDEGSLTFLQKETAMKKEATQTDDTELEFIEFTDKETDRIDKMKWHDKDFELYAKSFSRAPLTEDDLIVIDRHEKAWMAKSKGIEEATVQLAE